MVIEVPDFVPLQAFAVLDFMTALQNQPLTQWQRRLIIGLCGPGPADPEEEQPL